MHGSILLVDDEPNVRDAVRHMLEDAGLRVLTAASGADAVAIIESHRGAIQAVVLDVTMPDLNGEETLDRIRRLQPGVPAVFMSGYSERAERWNDSASSHVAFVQKPFRQHEIVARLNEVWPTE
jgi:CheY-like chemotaxis protein